ncbi:hypothetical protein Tco_0491543 [Tanacetum coccineum]
MDRQKSYADNRRKPLEFEVGDRVMLKVSPWKGVVHFGKKGKLAPRYVGPFEILERISLVAYRLRLPEELSGVHDTLHVSNLKKCLADASQHVPLNEIKVDKTLHFIEEPVEILDQEIKSLKRSKISLVKIRIETVLKFDFLRSTCACKWLLEIHSDQLEWVLWYAPWLSDQLEWICGMLHGLVINWSSSAIETSRNRVNGFNFTIELVSMTRVEWLPINGEFFPLRFPRMVDNSWLYGSFVPSFEWESPVSSMKSTIQGSSGSANGFTSSELEARVCIQGKTRFLNDEGYNGGFEEGDIEKAFVAMKENYEAWVCGFATLAIGADVPVAGQEFGHCSTCSQTFQYIHIPYSF